MKNKILIFLLICTIVLIGAGIRLWYAGISEYNIDCDTATLGIMAMHVLQGSPPMFFYGQEYLGSFEAFIIALFFLVFGISNYAMFYAMIFISAVFLISIYFLAKEFYDKRTALIALAFCSIGTPYFILHNVLPYGYHILMLILGNILFLIALKIIKSDKKMYYILMGVTAGISFWLHYATVYYFLPVAVFLLLRKNFKTLLKNIRYVIISFFIGALPFWIYTFMHQFKTLVLPGSDKLLFFHVLADSVPLNFAILFGLGRFVFNINEPLSFIISLVYFGSIVYFTAGVSKQKNNILFILLFISIVIIFGLNSYHAVKENTYYIMPLYTFLPVVFAYAITNLAKKRRLLGYSLFLLVLAYNFWNDCKWVKQEEIRLEGENKNYTGYIDFLERNKINRIICGEADNPTVQFLTKERVIITGFGGSEYLPYDFIVESADRVGVKNLAEGEIDTVCKGYACDYGIYYNIIPYNYLTKCIPTEKWIGDSDYSADKTKYAFDRDYDKWWSSVKPEKTGMYFTIDMGREYKICRFNIFIGKNFYAYPNACHIEISKDGRKWEEIKFIKGVEPLFISGPRPYWHLQHGRWEVNFIPVKTRYLRLVQEGNDEINPWEINEIFIYEYEGENQRTARDYVYEAKNITDFLINKKINFVYADFWLSAKVKVLSGNKIGVLAPFNRTISGTFEIQKNTDRRVKLSRDTAYLVEKGDEILIENIIKEFGLPLYKKNFGIYTCYYFKEFTGTYMEGIGNRSWLYWIGIGMVKYNVKDFSDLIYEYGLKLEEDGHYKEAAEYYKESTKYFTSNINVYKNLGNICMKTGLEKEAGKYINIIRNKFTPKVKRLLIFKNGVEFLGYGINGNVFKRGGLIKMDYFWKIKGKELPYAVGVFVYFMKDGKICFQNDHAFLNRYVRPVRISGNEVFRESFGVIAPDNISPGKYEIIMGLWNPEKGGRISVRKTKETKFVIGEIEVI